MQTFLKNTKVRFALVLTYILLVLGYSVASRAESAENFIFINNTAAQERNVVGEVAVTLDGQAFLIVSDELAFELQADEDLTAFNGQRVLVNGYELLHKIGPVHQLASFHKFLDDAAGDDSRPAPVLVVVQINELAE